jgi:hypothetical protein
MSTNKIQNILNCHYLEKDSIRVMKLIPVFIHTKIQTFVKFEVSVFNETKITKSIVKYTYRPTDRNLKIYKTHVYIVFYGYLDLISSKVHKVCPDCRYTFCMYNNKIFSLLQTSVFAFIVSRRTALSLYLDQGDVRSIAIRKYLIFIQ